MREAEAMASRLGSKDVEGRKDLRDVPFLTIDPEDARDHDDAVFAERVAGGYRVWIAIADVAEYVQPGTALDAEALARGCTIYLPDRALPMLPAALAADVCSLLPERERLCLCVTAEIDDGGRVVASDVMEGRMRGAAMLTYGSVARTLGFTDKPPQSPQAEAFKKDLRVLDDVARKLRRGRMRRGALDFDLPEPKLKLDPTTGEPLGVTRRTEDPGVKRAYQMIEEMMILGNELVAEWLGKRKSPAVYRVHNKPDLTKLGRLADVCETLGVEFDVDEVQEMGGVGKWLKKIQEHPKKAILEMLLLRSMKQATYDITNIGHFGLASTAYVHFTSPIRRYPDVQVHRAVKRLLRGGRPDVSPQAIESLAASATDASTHERAAVEVEREVVDLYRALFMRSHIGETFEGTITALTGTGVYVSLDDPFVDVLVRHESLGPDSYRLNDEELAVVGARSGDRITLGDRLVVIIEDASVVRRAVLARRVVPERVLHAVEGGGDAFAGAEGRRRPREERPAKGRDERHAGRGKGGGAREEHRSGPPRGDRGRRSEAPPSTHGQRGGQSSGGELRRGLAQSRGAEPRPAEPRRAETRIVEGRRAETRIVEGRRAETRGAPQAQGRGRGGARSPEPARAPQGASRRPAPARVEHGGEAARGARGGRPERHAGGKGKGGRGKRRG